MVYNIIMYNTYININNIEYNKYNILYDNNIDIYNNVINNIYYNNIDIYNIHIDIIRL